MRIHLTTRILNGIVEASGIIEAGGPDECQGHMLEADREKAFMAIVDAGRWAAQELHNRKLANSKRMARHSVIEHGAVIPDPHDQGGP